MPTTLRNTDILFNDGTTQSTAAVSGPGATGTRGQVFTSNGTFTIPTGITAVKVTVVGGGGGGNANTFAGAGGGTAIRFLTGLTSGATLSVAVGSGGAGGTGFGNGGTGGSSTVSSGSQSITTITGGGGGGGNTGVGGGTATNGDVNASGSLGGSNTSFSPDGVNTFYFYGNAGSSLFGTGAPAIFTVNNASATVISGGFGSGGQAPHNNSSGQAGRAGIVIFEW